MGTSSGGAGRYQIIVRGECGDMLAAAIEGLAVEARPGSTCVVASVRDDSEFYGLLDRFQDLALQPVSLNEIDGGPDDLTGPPVTPRGDPAPGTG
jgi:hypothetical protein